MQQSTVFQLNIMKTINFNGSDKTYRIIIQMPFDGLMSFGDATTLWSLNESTLRKAIAYGKLVNGVDVCKFGKQWVVSMAAMIREYGNPKM